MKSEVRHIGLLILSLLSVIMTGCRDYDADVVANNAPVRVDIAFTFSSSVAVKQHFTLHYSRKFGKGQGFL